jgi:hypothetical protein
MHVAPVATSATTPTVVANGGVACGSRLLRNIIMRWVAEHMGRKGRDKEKKTKKCLFPCCMSGGRRRRNSATSKRHRFFSLFFFLFFLKPHETASFCLKRTVSFK